MLMSFRGFPIGTTWPATASLKKREAALTDKFDKIIKKAFEAADATVMRSEDRTRLHDRRHQADRKKNETTREAMGQTFLSRKGDALDDSAEGRSSK